MITHKTLAHIASDRGWRIEVHEYDRAEYLAYYQTTGTDEELNENAAEVKLPPPLATWEIADVDRDSAARTHRELYAAITAIQNPLTPTEAERLRRIAAPTDNTVPISLPVEHGALREAPVFEPHKRGRNWCAVIQPDPAKPGGLDRAFLEVAKGDGNYYLTAPIRAGDALEFGADYISGSGNPQRKRFYAVVLEATDQYIELEPYPTARDCLIAAEKRQYDLRQPQAQLALLKTEQEQLCRRLDEVEAEIEAITGECEP